MTENSAITQQQAQDAKKMPLRIVGAGLEEALPRIS